MKVKMQMGHSASVLKTCKEIINQSGAKGFYRGMSSPLVGVTPMFAVSFWSYDMSCKTISHLKRNELSKTDYAAAGAISALPTSLVCTPVERIKVLLQTQEHSKSALGTIIEEVKHGKFKSMYTGMSATLSRDVPGAAIYFWAYESALMLAPRDSPNLLNVLLAGGISGMAMWSAVIPVDAVKSKIQSSPNGTYRGMLHCAKVIFSERGIRGFFNGVGPALFRAFVVSIRAISIIDPKVKCGSLPHSRRNDKGSQRDGIILAIVVRG